MKEYSLREVYKITRYVNYFEEKRKIEKVGKSEKIVKIPWKKIRFCDGSRKN